jgi:hypothetical protein
MRKLLLSLLLLSITQTSFTAILKVKNWTNTQPLSVIVSGEGAEKSRNIPADGSYYTIDSGLNPIYIVSWQDKESKYWIAVSISQFSVSHYLSIGMNGKYQYDGKDVDVATKMK